jgi:hypothetical protein
VVEVVELASTVVEVEAEVAVVIEEVPAVLRRDLLVPCPFGGLEYCGVGAPLRYQFYTNSLAPTSRKDSQLQGEKKIRRERVKRDKSHFQLLYLVKYSEAIQPDFFN